MKSLAKAYAYMVRRSVRQSGPTARTTWDVDARTTYARVCEIDSSPICQDGWYWSHDKQEWLEDTHQHVRTTRGCDCYMCEDARYNVDRGWASV